MTRIDFYIIPQDQLDQVLHFACRLTEKAYKLQNKVTIKVNNEEEASVLDDLLWNFKPESFIPHVKQNDSEEATIQIVWDQLGSDYDVLINLSDEIPLEFTRFQRVTQVASQHPDQRAKSREHYKYYKERGYPIHNHDLRRKN
jgi:DNA polymerase-3 subunit chi